MHFSAPKLRNAKASRTYRRSIVVIASFGLDHGFVERVRILGSGATCAPGSDSYVGRFAHDGYGGIERDLNVDIGQRYVRHD
jgi:hypothetical protein